jgi:hypothetical protein
MIKNKKQHYVNNGDFLDAMVVYRDLVIESKETDSARPQMPNYIGECFIKIATHLSYKPNFINYTFRDDMIADGIENCIQYVDNFDPAKSKNPFAYFTQIIYFAFLRRIQKEKKQLYIKYKSIERAGIFEKLAEVNNPDDARRLGQAKMYDNMYEFVDAFETAQREKKEKATQAKLDKK